MGHTRHTATLTNQARSSEPLGTGKRHRAISLISKCPVPPTCLAAAVLHDFHVQVPPDTDGDASQLPLHYLRSLHPGPTNPSKLTWSGRSHRPRVPSCRCRCVACKSTTAGNNTVGCIQVLAVLPSHRYARYSWKLESHLCMWRRNNPPSPPFLYTAFSTWSASSSSYPVCLRLLKDVTDKLVPFPKLQSQSAVSRAQQSCELNSLRPSLSRVTRTNIQLFFLNKTLFSLQYAFQRHPTLGRQTPFLHT